MFWTLSLSEDKFTISKGMHMDHVLGQTVHAEVLCKFITARLLHAYLFILLVKILSRSCTHINNCLCRGNYVSGSWDTSYQRIVYVIQAVFISPPQTLAPVTTDIQTHAWSIKYRLITKLNAQIETNLRDESIKLNQSMI